MKTVTLEKMSDYIILFCQNMGVAISPLKLQKLLYYVQSWHIAKFNKESLFEELPEAWVNGPVYRSVYNIFKTQFFRNQSILTELSDDDLNEGLVKMRAELDVDKEQLDLIDSVLKAYSKLSDERLVIMSHSESPWNEAREGYSTIERCTKQLQIDTIFNYFNKIDE